MCGLLCLALLPAAGHAERILHEERSLYSDIVVKHIGNRVCLQFKVRSDQRNQSCFDRRAPRRMVFSYTRMAMAGLLFAPEPASALIIGLGGGTVPTALAELYPDIEIDAVEIDPAVVKVAREFFAFETGDRMRVHTQDARVWVKRALLKQRQFDYILLDAFNGEYIPEHLMTAEFFEELKALLGPEGVMVSNTFGMSRFYSNESATYKHVFGDFINFRMADSSNRIVIAPVANLSDETLLARARELEAPLKPYAVPIRKFSRNLVRLRGAAPDWDTGARVFTDQYSPANVLHN